MRGEVSTRTRRDLCVLEKRCAFLWTMYVRAISDVRRGHQALCKYAREVKCVGAGNRGAGECVRATMVGRCTSAGAAGYIHAGQFVCLFVSFLLFFGAGGCARLVDARVILSSDYGVASTSVFKALRWSSLFLLGLVKAQRRTFPYRKVDMSTTELFLIEHSTPSGV